MPTMPLKNITSGGSSVAGGVLEHNTGMAESLIHKKSVTCLLCLLWTTEDILYSFSR